MANQNQVTVEKELITEYRPWGYYTVLEEKDNYKVKKLVVNSGERLSLQLHNHRHEQWIIVEGEAILRCEDDTKTYFTGESATIPKGAVHRIENRSRSKVVIIEVQNGEYLGEDDIIRFEDDYSRVKDSEKNH